jgi:predicted transcriptional regulator
MPRRITAEIDMSILRDIGMGIPNKEVARNYGVSASYVSKLKTGKKVPDMYIVGNAVTTVYPVSDIVQWLEIKIKNLDKERNIYTQILSKYKGE